MRPEIFELFAERFPRYAFSLYEWTPIPDSDEEPSLTDLPLEEAEVIYLYGLKATQAQKLFPWLKKNSKHRLIFLEPQTGIIASFLEDPLAKKILSQKQIEIYYLPQRKEKEALLEELSQKHPHRGVFVSYCRGDKRSFNRIKLDLLKKTALTHANFVDGISKPTLLSHWIKNIEKLPTCFYANRLKNAFQSIPAIICGAGPSLQKAIEDLRKVENRAIIFAGGSAISALSAQGIEPHFAVAIDPNLEEFERLKNSFSFETPLLFSTRLHPECLATANGPLGYLRSGMSGVVELWMEEMLGLDDLPLGANLPPESLSVTTLAASIAHHFGCNPILFEGIDLAYTSNRRYADGVDAKEEASEFLQPVDRILTCRNRHGKNVSSAVRWVMEANALSQFAKASNNCRWIQCTTDGLEIKGIESMPLSSAKKLFVHEYDLRGTIHSLIQNAPMPQHTKALLKEKTQELKKSLANLLAHLDVLIEQKPGLSSLAEIEIQDELSTQLLFYDIDSILSLTLKDPKDKVAYWKAFRELALQCQASLS